MATKRYIVGEQLLILSDEQSVVMAKGVEFDAAVHRIDWSVPIVDVVELIVVDGDGLMVFEAVKQIGYG